MPKQASLKQFIDWLLRPASRYEAIARRDQQLLERLLLVLACVVLLEFLRSLLMYLSGQSTDFIFELTLAIIIVSGFVANRLKHTQSAVLFGSLSAVVVIAGLALPNPHAYDIFYFVLVPAVIMMSALFLPPIGTIAVMIASLLGVLIVAAVAPVGQPIISTIILYIVTMTALILAAVSHLRENVALEHTEVLKNEALLNAITSNLMEIISVGDAQGKITYTSPSIQTITGYTPDEIVVDGVFQLPRFIHPDDQAHAISAFNAAMTAIPPVSARFEFRFLHKDGHYIWLEALLNFECDSDGKILRAIYVSRDISERKAVEEKLLAERNLLRTIIDSIPYHVYVKDREQRFLLNNQFHIAALGARTQEEVLGKTDRDLFPPHWAEEFSRDDYQVLSTGNPLLGKVERMLSSDRTPMWGLATKVPLRDNDGAIIGLVGATIDISKEVEAREALMRSEAMQKAFLEAIPDLIFRMDAKGVFLDYKPSKSMNTFVAPDEFLGRSIREVLPVYLANKHLLVSETVLSTGQPYTYEYELPDDNEQMRSYEARMVANGGNEVITIVRDVTDMKIAEEERLEKERLQTRLAKEREIADLRQLFTSTLSHEFRTPLATIMTSVQMLENYGARMAEENRQNRLKVIRGQVNHLVNMLNDILTIMQVQGSQLRFTPEMQDVARLVTTITQEFQGSIGVQHHLHVQAQPDLGLLPIDPRLFRYIYFNLLTNAIKYSDTGKHITTRLEHDGNLLKLSVSDEGIGIPKVDQVRLFQAFQRGSNVSMISGSGLGLKIVKDCIDLHRGTIEIESEENVGTTVIVRLPTQYSRDKRYTTDEQTLLH